MSKEMHMQAREILLELLGREPTMDEISEKLEDMISSEIDQAMDRLEEEQ